jgi:hypothetical protein
MICPVELGTTSRDQQPHSLQPASSAEQQQQFSIIGRNNVAPLKKIDVPTRIRNADAGKQIRVNQHTIVKSGGISNFFGVNNALQL